MKKQAKFCALAAITVVSAASMAQATDINLYGSSAQFNFWQANAQTFVASKCTSTPASATTKSMVVQDSYGTQNVSQGFIQGTSCSSPYTSPLTFRFGGIASAEGYLALEKKAPLFTPVAGAQGLSSNSTLTCNISNGERLMLSDTTGTNYGCFPVNVATTDLAITDINQYADPTVVTLPTFATPAANGFSDETSVVTPFAFSVSNTVTANQCFSATGDNLGFSCASTADCNVSGVFVPTTNVCTNAVIDNLSRLQVVELFQGEIANWNQFGSNFTSQPVQLCLRVPGSGTHATLDLMVMSAGNLGWGSLGQFEFPSTVNTDSTNPPLVSYVESTAGMQGCLANPGAVGYMDANKPSAANGSTGTTGYTRIKYNGNAASRNNLVNGLYDFYAVGHMYYTPGNASVMHPLQETTTNPTNINSLLSGISLFYAAQGEMNFLRGSDTAYPTQQ